MALIGTLAIGVTATVDKATRNLRKLQKGIGDLTGGVSSAVGKLAGFGTALAGIAGAAGLTALVKNSFEAIDATGKLAGKLGMASESLVALTHQGNLAGVSQDTLATSLQKMLINIDNATRGAGSAKEAFAALTLDPKKLSNGSPEAAYRQIADAIAGVNGAQKQLVLTTQIFGRSGGDLIGMLREGSAGMDRADEAARRLRLSFSDVDAKMIEEANDSVSTLGEAIQGVANKVALALAPMVDFVADKFTSWIADTASGTDFVTTIWGGLVKVIGFGADLFHMWKMGWQAWKVIGEFAILGITGGIELLIRGLDKVNELLGFQATGWADTFAAFNSKLVKTIDEDIAHLKEMQTAFPGFQIETQLNEIAAASRQAAQSAADLQKKTREAGLGVQAIVEPTKEVASIFADLQSQLDKLTLNDEQQLIAKLNAAGANTQEIDQAIAKLREIKSIERSLDLDKKAKALIDDIKSPIEQLSDFMREINELGDRLTDSQRQKLIAKRAAELFGGGDADPGAPAALQFGSVEARSAELAGLRRMQGERDQIALMKQRMKEAEKQSKTHVDKLEEIRQAIVAGKVEVSDN